jgi:hypothetical protein
MPLKREITHFMPLKGHKAASLSLNCLSFQIFSHNFSKNGRVLHQAMEWGNKSTPMEPLAELASNPRNHRCRIPCSILLLDEGVRYSVRNRVVKNLRRRTDPKIT